LLASKSEARRPAQVVRVSRCVAVCCSVLQQFVV